MTGTMETTGHDRLAMLERLLGLGFRVDGVDSTDDQLVLRLVREAEQREIRLGPSAARQLLTEDLEEDPIPA